MSPTLNESTGTVSIYIIMAIAVHAIRITRKEKLAITQLKHS